MLLNPICLVRALLVSLFRCVGAGLDRVLSHRDDPVLDRKPRDGAVRPLASRQCTHARLPTAGALPPP